MIINWYNLKKKHPKVYEAIMQWSERVGDPLMHDRALLDFFDEQEIYIIPLQEIVRGKTFWGFRIGSERTLQEFRAKKTYTTRTKAEEEAYEKAIKIFEDKLKERNDFRKLKDFSSQNNGEVLT